MQSVLAQTIDVKVNRVRIPVPLALEEEFRAGLKENEPAKKGNKTIEAGLVASEAIAKRARKAGKRKEIKKSIDSIVKGSRRAKKRPGKAVGKSYEQQSAAEFYSGKGIDYSQLYSYRSNVKEKAYITEFSDFAKAIELDVQHDDDFFKPKFRDSMMREVIRAKKMRDTYGVEVYVSPVKSAIFDMWNLGHRGDNQIFYMMINV